MAFGALGLLAVACGSEGDALIADSTPATTAEVTEAAEPPADDTTAPAAADATLIASTEVVPIVIHGNVDFLSETNMNTVGDFEVAEGAEVFGCSSGSQADIDQEAGGEIDKILNCRSGPREGTVTLRWSINSGRWTVIEATDDFEGLLGAGEWTGEVDEAGNATETLTGSITYGGDLGFAEPLERFGRLPGLENACDYGFVTVDGLHEFATVSGEFLHMDLLTQEVSGHGAPPSDCAVWLGDEARGRRASVSLEGDRAWFGPFDGPFETEVDLDSPVHLVSRSFAANRLLFFEYEKDQLVLRDATTGEVIGDPISGGFTDGRTFSSNVVNADETRLAIGAANPGGPNGDGLIIMLDPATGEELFQLGVPSPVTTLVFDEKTQELIAGSFTGELYTIDLDTRDVVSEVFNSSGATIGAIGLRPDGLVITYTSRAIELIDRTSGPTGVEIRLGNSNVARIRPDGTINSTTPCCDHWFETYVIDG